MSARVERRWIVLGQDGRHITLGRAAPPTDEEIAAASEALAAQGLGGWIATLDGSYWDNGRLTLAPVQTIGVATDLNWPAAEAAFEAIRGTAVTPQRRGRVPAPRH